MFSGSSKLSKSCNEKKTWLQILEFTDMLNFFFFPFLRTEHFIFSKKTLLDGLMIVPATHFGQGVEVCLSRLV